MRDYRDSKCAQCKQSPGTHAAAMPPSKRPYAGNREAFVSHPFVLTDK